MSQIILFVGILILNNEQVISLELYNHGSQDQTWTETAMSSLLRDTLEFFDPCFLVIAHDYQPLLPRAFINLIHNRSLTGKTTAIIKHQITPTTTPSTGPPDPNEHWFSWLHRSSRTYHGNCVFATVLFDSMEHFEQLMEQTAKIISLHTTQHHFLFWHRNDLNPFNPSWLLHPHSHVMLYKLAAVPTPSGKDIKLFSTCFYCQQGKPQVVPIGWYNPLYTKPFKSSLELVYPDFTNNLHGKHLMGSFIYPITLKELKRRQAVCEPVFFSDAVWVAIANHLNFTWETWAISVDDSGLADTQLPNGTWVGTVGQVLYRVADFCPLTPSSDSAPLIVDLTRPILMDFINFLTREPQPAYSWEAIIQPYTPGMWLLIFISTTICTVIFWRIILALGTFQNPFAPKQFPKHSLGYSIRYLFFTVVEENPELLPTGHTLRVFLAFWWLFSIVITCAYDCKLISFLAAPHLEDLPTTFQELTTKPGWEWGMNNTQAAFYHMMVESSDIPYLHAIEPKLQRTPNFFNCVSRTLDGDFACITAESFLVTGALLFVYQDGHCPIILQKEKSLDLFFTPILEKHSILTPVINKMILYIFDSGLMSKYTKDFSYCSFITGLRIARSINRARSLSMAFKFEQMKGPIFVIIIFGWLLPLIIFTGELQYSRNQKKKYSIDAKVE